MARQLLAQAFDATRVSMRLMMFHVAFLRVFRVAGPTGLPPRADGKRLTTAQVMEQLNACWTRPTPAVQDHLQADVKAIFKVSSWRAVFRRVGLTPPSPGHLSMWLVQAVRNSERRHYHRRAAVEADARRMDDVRVQRARALRPRVEVDQWDELVARAERGRARRPW